MSGVNSTSSHIDISKLGMEGNREDPQPNFPCPEIISDFDGHSDNTYDSVAYFKDLLENKQWYLESLLKGDYQDLIGSSLDLVNLSYLPRIVDFSSGIEPDRVYFMLHYSSIQRIIVCDKRDVLKFQFLIPMTWSFTTRRFVVFVTSYPSGLEAQSLFSVDLNVQLPTEIMDLVKGMKGFDKPDMLSMIASLACKALAIYRCRKDPFAVTALLIDLFLQWKVSMILAVQACSYMADHLHIIFSFFTDGLKAQFDLSFIEALLKPLVSVVTCIVAVVGTTSLPGQKQIDNILHRMGNIGKALNGYKSMTVAFQDLIDRIFNTVYEIIFGVPYKKENLASFLDGLEDWYDKVEKLSTLDAQDNLTINFKLCRDVEQLYQRGQGYMRSMKDMQLTKIQMDPFHGYWRIVSRLYDRCVAQGARKAEPRTEPLIIHLFGGSGKGKSGLTYLLAQDLLLLEDLQEEVQNEVYFRMVEQEFWDGYWGQTVVVYDDWGQKIDTAASPNQEFMEIIRSGNIAPWPLHMAHLEDKARTRFVSRACILTSNERVYNMDSVTHKEAVERRKEITAEVLIKEDYLNNEGRLNTDKCKSALESDCYEFVLYINGQPMSTVGIDGSKTPVRLSYDKFALYCQEQYVKKYHQSKARLRCLESRGKKLSEKRKALVDKLQAQVDEDDLFWESKAVVERDSHAREMPAEAIAFPYVWLTIHSEPFTGDVIRDIFIDETLIEKLKELSSECDDFTDFQMKARSMCHHHGYDFTQRFARNEHRQANLLKVYSSKAFYYAKKALRSTRSYSYALFQHMRDTIVGYWTNVVNGDLATNIHLSYWCLVGLISFLMMRSGNYLKACQKKIEEAAPEQCFVYVSPDGQQSLCTEDELSKWCDKHDIVNKLPTKLEGEVNEKVICFSCYQVGHYANKCPIDIGIKERRRLYQQTHMKVESNDETVHKRKPVVAETSKAESNDEVVHKRKHMVAEGNRSVKPESNDEVVHKRKAMVAEVDLRPHYAQASIDNNAREVASTIIPRNMYMVYSMKNGVWIPRVNLLFVKGHCAIIVAHAMPFLGSRILLRNQYNPQGIEVEFKDLTFHQMKNKAGEELDVQLVVFPKWVPIHRTITNHFVKVADLSSFKSLPGNLYTVRNDDGLMVRYQYSLESITAIDLETYTSSCDNGVRTWTTRSGYAYHAETQSGDCTGVLMGSNGALARKILGIHVAGGSTGYAISQSVTQELLDSVLKNVPLKAQVYVDFESLNLINVDPKLPEGDFIPVGKLPTKIGGQCKSDLSESPLYGFVKEPSTKPAHLKPFKKDGKLIDPLMNGLKKCGKPNKLLDMDLVRRCVKSVFSKYHDNVKPEFRRVFDHAESIKGVVGEEYLGPINRRSSPGYPWAQKRKGTLGKTQWLGEGQDYDVENEELREAIENRISKAKQGIRVPTLWTDTLKDERRPIEKVDAGKTRVFAAGAMDYILACRRYYLGFFAHIMENRIENGSAVGINPYSNEWHRLALKMKSKGKHVIAGDFSNFDGSLIASVLWEINDNIKEWYFERFYEEDGTVSKENQIQMEEEDLVYDVLFGDIGNSIHVFGDDVYMWTHSQPSGNMGTVIFNTIFNEVMFRYVFVKVTKLSLIYFDIYIFFISFGDDNMANISVLIIHLFNQRTITEAFAEIGLTYTDEGKTGEVIESRELHEIAFLKRKFRFCEVFKKYVAPLDLDVVLEMTMWVKGKTDHEERCCSNVELAYRELALHGKEIFDRHSQFLARLCRKHLKGASPTLYDFIDYKECEMHIWC